VDKHHVGVARPRGVKRLRRFEPPRELRRDDIGGRWLEERLSGRRRSLLVTKRDLIARLPVAEITAIR
jgi:hypothetical protein